MTQFVAFIAVFVIVAIVLRIVVLRFRGLIKKLNYGPLDTVAGGILGALKGFLICVAIAVGLSFLSSGRLRSAADHSKLMPYAARTAHTVRIWLSRVPLQRLQEYLEEHRLRLRSGNR